MELDIEAALPLLTRTPRVLDTWLRGLPETWLRATEGPGTWSPHDVVGHLVHGERTDWMVRVRHILDHGDSRAFEPFDRHAQQAAGDETLEQRLDALAALREGNLAELTRLGLGPADLERPGRHPALGAVTLGQLLATWVAHDQTHIAQISRVLAKQYATAVGPWAAYLSVLHDRI